MTPLFSLARPMAFEVTVYILCIAALLFLAARRIIFPGKARGIGSYVLPLLIAIILAPCVWVLVALAWAGLL